MKKTPILLAMMIIATGQVGVSIYLPSLPMISETLQVNQADVQLLVTLFLVGFGASQLFYGPLSDAIGRRPVFLLGQGIYLIGTVICLLFSHNLWILVLGRLLQGLGAGSASVLGRSVLRDCYDGAELTKALSYVSGHGFDHACDCARLRWLGGILSGLGSRVYFCSGLPSRNFYTGLLHLT